MWEHWHSLLGQSPSNLGQRPTFCGAFQSDKIFIYYLEKKNPLLYNQNKIHLETKSKKNYISDMKLKSIK